MIKRFLKNNKKDFEKGLLIISNLINNAKNKISYFFFKIYSSLSESEIKGRQRIENGKKLLKEIKESRTK